MMTLPMPLSCDKPLRQDVARRVVHLALRQRLRGQREDEDRGVGRIDLAIGRIARQVGRQVGAGGVDRGLDVARRAVDVAADIELERDAGLPDAALRGHLGHVGDLAEMTFERLGNAGRHRVRDLRREAGRSRRWSENRPAAAAIPAVSRSRGRRQGDRHGQQRRRHRPRDEWRRDVHSPGSGISPGASGTVGSASGDPHRQAIEIEIDDRRGEQA